MARLEMPEFTPAELGAGPVTADTMFELGMMYASGREVPVDLVTAHKWFNIAAMKGHAEAAQLRREVAAEMQDAEIGQAQRAARDWLKAHPEPVAAAADGAARGGLIRRSNGRFRGRMRVSGAGAHPAAAIFRRHCSQCLTRNRRNYRALRDGEVAEWLKATVC